MFYSLIFNLKDKEENRSGKGLGLSLFGVLDGEKESKNAEVFERLADAMGKKGAKAAIILKKEYNNLTTAGKKTADDMLASTKNTTKLSRGFSDAGKAANKMTFASKAAAVGMQVLNTAMNMGIMLLVSVAIQGLVVLIDNLVHAQEKAIERANELTDAWQNRRGNSDSNHLGDRQRFSR